MKILSVIPICREDATRAELLLDLIYQLEGRKTTGSVLLVFAPEVHQEMKDKLKIAASLAFETVDLFDVKQLVVANKEKYSSVWAMFYNTAQHVAQNYRWPWLWLEPDCLPVSPGWREKLWQAYDGQPKRYLSRRMKAGENVFCHRIGVYPVNILNDIQAAQTAQMDYYESITGYCTFTDLFQQASITSKDDVNKVRQDAVLLHHDKTGALADWVRGNKTSKPEVSEFKTVEEAIEASDGDTIQIHRNGTASIPKRRGRPPKVQPTSV